MVGRKYGTFIGLFASVLLAAACSREPEVTATAVDTTGAPSAVVEGMVTDAAGQPLAGAFVKLRNPERRLLFMVVSQDGGRYTANKLPEGNYIVQGVGGDFESAWSAPVPVKAEGPAKIDVALTASRAADLPAAWPRRLPEESADLDTLPAGHGRDLIAQYCGSCHSSDSVAAFRFDHALWESTVEEMRELMKGSNLPDMTDADQAALMAYLDQNLPPMAPPNENARLPRDLMQGEARNYRVVQYDIENEGAEAHDVAVDPWGVGWANQRIGGKIGRFDPVTYEYSEIGPPLYTAERARLGNLQISKDGIIWLADPFEKRWLSYDIQNKKWTDWMFPMDKIRGQVQGNTIALHPEDGTVWMSGPGSARRLDPKTGEFMAWDTPTWKETQRNPGGYGMTVDGSGRVWMAMNLVDKLARFDAKTGEVKEFKIPVQEIAYPRRMDRDPNGDVWVGLWAAGKILKIDHKTEKMTVIEPPIPHSGAYSIDFDDKNNLMWITLHMVDLIARYNPATGEWLMLPMPQAETDVRRVEVDQNNPNRVWWSSVANNARIGYVELLDN